MLEPCQKEAIEGTILKPILEYRPFSMQRELTAALVNAWVPRRKSFRLTGRLVPFSVYDVTLFTGLPVTDKIVEFGEDDLSTTELARMKYMEDICRIGEYAWAEAMRRVLVEAIEEIQRKLEGLCGSTSTQQGLQNMTSVSSLNWQVRIVSTMGKFDGIIGDPYVALLGEEMLVPTVRAFMKTDGFRDYVLDGEGVLSYEERLQRAREELHAEKGKHSRANELEARLKMCAAPCKAQDTGHQPGGDVRVDVQSDSGLESLARAITVLGEVTVHIPGASCDAQNTPPRIVDAAAPLNGCDNRGDAPQCSEPHVQPSAEVEDVGEIAVVAAAMPCEEGKGSAQEPPEPVVGESGALPGPHVREEAANIDAPSPGVDEVYVGGDLAVGEGVSTTLASSAVNVEDCTPGATEGVDCEATLDPGMQFVHTARPMAAEV
ncbi:hypothetical protein Cgig2_027483 [Carnegiea gigantea]|uniref:Uncharacterized protein n=1 Tax=Carnegiea gigantea TaxID=171969 RepID=A0A9Q1QM24_9CARY|nr:hypothetical protein Cgig2_027483 [Carnegiea gigantea]